MSLKSELANLRNAWRPLTIYERFEQTCVIILTGLIALVVVLAIWHLALHVIGSILTSSFDPTDFTVFQSVFGMIFTVIIALEFKRSLLVIAERHHNIVQARAVVLIALLAVVRKLIILDVHETDPSHLFALSAAILALGVVYWLVRDPPARRRDSVGGPSAP